MSNNEQIDAPVVSPDDSEKKVQTLEEDDEFEDFPSECMYKIPAAMRITLVYDFKQPAKHKY